MALKESSYDLEFVKAKESVWNVKNCRAIPPFIKTRSTLEGILSLFHCSCFYFFFFFYNIPPSCCGTFDRKLILSGLSTIKAWLDWCCWTDCCNPVSTYKGTHCLGGYMFDWDLSCSTVATVPDWYFILISSLLLFKCLKNNFLPLHMCFDRVQYLISFKSLVVGSVKSL